ncbi:MAG: AI-2E family transporter [Polyangiaceae bacterium]
MSDTPPPISIRAPRSAGRRVVFLAVSAALAVATIVAAHDVLLPFVLALLIAYVLTPLVAWCETKGFPRALAIISVYVLVLGSFGTFVRGVTPRMASELRALRHEVPVLASRARDEWIPDATDKLRSAGLLPAPQDLEPRRETPEPALVARPRADGSYEIEIGSGVAIKQTKTGYLVERERETKDGRFDPNVLLADAVGKSFAYAQHNALELARLGRDLVAGVSRIIFKFFITLMLAAYVMMTREKILGFFESLVRPRARGDFHMLVQRVDRGLSGVVRGQLLICLLNGVLSAVGFALVGLKYWPVMALVATVFSLVPIFGSIISTIPAVALGLTQSVGTAAFVLVWVLVIHQVEANLLNPKIMGDAAKIHPVLVVFSLLVGEHFFHIVGALLAVPVMSIAQSLFLHFRIVVQRDDAELAPETTNSLIPPANG